MILKIIAAVRRDDVHARSHHVGFDASVEGRADGREAASFALSRTFLVGLPHPFVVDDPLSAHRGSHADDVGRTGRRQDAALELACTQGGVHAVGDEDSIVAVDLNVGILADDFEGERPAPYFLVARDGDVVACLFGYIARLVGFGLYNERVAIVVGAGHDVEHGVLLCEHLTDLELNGVVVIVIPYEPHVKVIPRLQRHDGILAAVVEERAL